MIKTIKIGNKSVKLDNNIVWALKYRNQFGKDIIPTLMPAIAASFDVISGVLNNAEDASGQIDLNKILNTVDGEYFLNAVIHLGELEFNDFVDIIWALAKTADDNIPEPERWLRQFDVFPIDEIAPAVVSLIVKGVVSGKNLKRLNDLKKKVQPLSNSTTSSSQQQSEG